MDLVFSFTSTAFFLVGTFGSQFKISTLADTFGTYLYKQTGHPDALFGCSTPTIIFGLAIAAGVIGTALSLITLFLSVVQLRSPSSSAGNEGLMKHVFIWIVNSVVVLDTFLIASYVAHFCDTTASFSANGDPDYGFIVSMVIFGVLLLCAASQESVKPIAIGLFGRMQTLYDATSPTG